MKYLITSSRMPTAIDQIRKLARAGNAVLASDTFRGAPGSRSNVVEKSFVTPSPRFETGRFIAEVARIIEEEQVDCLLPAFEEVLYLARHREELPLGCRCFFPDFETLARLHDKASLARLAEDIGVRVPRGVTVTSRDDLAAATRELPEYFAKPVFSRGGVELYTNVGPLAGMLGLDQCDPREEAPWLVQEFVHGLDVCTFGVSHAGKLAAHAAYVHPREIDHAGGIVFESVDEPEALDLTRRIAEATGYTGQISFDLMKTDRGYVLIECNPRPTAGTHVMSGEMLSAALLDDAARELRVVPAGVRMKYSTALLRNMVLHVEEAREDARYLLSDAKEVIAEIGDPLPALYQVLSYGQVLAFQRQNPSRAGRRTDLKAAYFEDILFNGEGAAEAEAGRIAA